MLQTLFDLLYWRHLTPSGGDTWDCFNLIWTSWRLRLSHYCGAMTQQSPAAAAVLQTLQNTMTITSCSTFSDVALPEKLQISVCDLWDKRWLWEIIFSLWHCKIIHWFSAEVSNIHGNKHSTLIREPIKKKKKCGKFHIGSAPTP